MSNIQIGGSFKDPLATDEVALQCPNCHKICYVKLPYKPTALNRQKLIKEAIDYHRRECPAVEGDEMYVTTINYPRK
jgi:hypothetical protein